RAADRALELRPARGCERIRVEHDRVCVEKRDRRGEMVETRIRQVDLSNDVDERREPAEGIEPGAIRALAVSEDGVFAPDRDIAEPLEDGGLGGVDHVIAEVAERSCVMVS